MGETLNVYQKLQKCRAKLKTLPIKESGNNTFAKYTYMELGDFLPHIVDLCEEFQLCPVISFGENATLTVFNSEKPEEFVVFSSPMSTADLKGCHQIQNLGAVETYLRRYLYVSAFDIVEHDALDATTGDKDKQQQRQQAAKSSPQGANAGKEIVEPTKARVELLNELGQIFHGRTDEMADALRTYSSFEGKDGEKYLTLANLERPTDNEKMHKWFGSALGKLRKDAQR